MESVKGTSLVI